MKILDANMVLRFLVRDNEEMAKKVIELLDTERCLFTNEVAAEVVYVLGGIYKMNRADISKGMLTFLEVDGVVSTEYDVMSMGLKFFGETSFDFVDCLLIAYDLQYGYEVCTFDKKLAKYIQRLHSKDD